MPPEVSVLEQKLSKHTSFFGIKLWVLIIASTVASVLVITLIILSFFFFLCRHTRKPYPKPNFCLPLSHIAPNKHRNPYNRCTSSSLDNNNVLEVLSGRWSAQSSSGFAKFTVFTLMEINQITNGFSDENLVGRGEYGIVYRGLLLGTVPVAVKKLLMPARRYESEEFVARAEAIASVRHKNIVKLLGYCIEGDDRMLVYEYVENKDLHEWLHGSIGEIQPLTWKKRMKIIQGIAKGLAYLHEDIEPKITHQDIKPSKILLDYLWNPKISDVGFTELLAPDYSNVLTDAMIKPGYSPGLGDEKSDVHSFGILIMEIVSGKIPVDESQPQVYLVDQIKSMVGKHKIMDVVDPRLPDFPFVKELKRVILIALRCVDSDIKHRPKMGDVIHMLEPRDLLLSDAAAGRIRQESSYRNNFQEIHNVSHSWNQYQKMIP